MKTSTNLFCIFLAVCSTTVGIAKASFWDQIPVISQTKSFVQWVSGDSEGARATQDNFIHSPILAYIPLTKAAVEGISGDGEAAKRTLSRMTNTYVDNLEGLADGTPVVGHGKAAIHYAVGDQSGGDRVMKTATRSVGVIGGGAIGFLGGGPVGAAAGGAAGGLLMDGAMTGIESGIHKEYRPSGHIASATNIVKGEASVGDIFDLGANFAGDLAAGAVAGKSIMGKPKASSSSGGKTGSEGSTSTKVVRCRRRAGGSCGGGGTTNNRPNAHPFEVDLNPPVMEVPPQQPLGVGQNFVSQNKPTFTNLKPSQGGGGGSLVVPEPLFRGAGWQQGAPGAAPAPSPFLQAQTPIVPPANSVPFINPGGNGMFFQNWLKASAATALISGKHSNLPTNNKLDEPLTNPNDQEKTDEKEEDSDEKHEPRCHDPPEIRNMNRDEMQSCTNTKAGDRCRVMCPPNHEPTVKSVVCVKRHDVAQWDIPDNAECRPNTDPVCRDNFNRKVDWFVAYRLPKAVNLRQNSFLFISNDTMGPEDFINLEQFTSWRDGVNGFTNWVFDQGLFSRQRSAVGFTLAPLRGNQNLQYLMYNDGTAGSRSSDHGHVKGVLVHNERVGFYMLHNLPNFPGRNGDLSSGSDQKGQLFMCITVDQSNHGIRTALSHISHLRPHVYSTTRGNLRNIVVPFPIPDHFPYFPLWTIRLRSEGGQDFSLMSKTSSTPDTLPNSDIYTSIAEETQTNILVQSEVKNRKGGRGKLPSHCPAAGTGYSVENLNFMYLPDPAHLEDNDGENWKTTKDHAKWLVAKDYTGDLFCAGDMNHERTQMGRWGGAICMNNFRVARAFRQLVREEDVENCVRDRTPNRPIGGT